MFVVEMKHIAARSVTGVLWLWLVLYVLRLYFQWLTIVAAENDIMNAALLWWIALFGLYMFVIAIHSKLVPWNRWMLMLIGVFIILLAELYLVDMPDRQVYTRDILKLLWVFLIIVGPMKLLITKKVEEERAMEEVEIIEV